jgi:hypothetical protein
MSRKIIADVLKKASTSYFLHKKFSCYTELGLVSWGHKRADVLAVSLMGWITIGEVKSCVHDYTTDKKWKTYLEHCNRFYFVFTHDTYTKLKTRLKEDLKGTGAGVLVLNPKTGYLDCKAYATKHLMTRKNKMLMLSRMAWRGGISKRMSRRTRHYINENKDDQAQSK